MKLAEALQERADLKKNIEQLKYRLVTNMLVQEGEKPAEDPQELMKQFDGCVSRMGELVTLINHKNGSTFVDGESLTSMISRRDSLIRRIDAYRDMVNSASRAAMRATRSEIKIFSTIDVRALQKQIDDLSKQLRELDNKIQMTNWTTDI
ncbi:MAG: DIP1984 family protein [Oscillospiraceae bacterium]|nr:hypothetical protein [Oscillospiraceae bacterium]MBQ9858596.1 DIP1984 family protein [Oscillospiraceae bacterium]